MFHKAIKLEYREGTTLELTFSDGKVKRYDMSALFGKYPQLTALKDRTLFTSGKLLGPYGIVWNDDLDIEAETVYEDGETVREEKPAAFVMVGNAVAAARARAKEGDIVFFSPASASFDMYKNFEERGEHFRSVVNDL